VRAVLLDSEGSPRVGEVPEPVGATGVVPGPASALELLEVLACGLCGSDVEKIGRAPAGTVLGHEVVARTRDGRRVALVHHEPCGACARCQAGHETTCERFPAPTIVPGGFAERVLARGGWVELGDDVSDARGTMAEPLACVLRGLAAVPRGRVLVVGNGFVGRLFGWALARRGDEVFAVDRDPRRAGRAPDGPVAAAVLCAPGGAAEALAALEPGGTLLAFADAGSLPVDLVYRRELTVTGRRSATPQALREAVALLPELELPEPVLLPLARFAEGLELYRRGEALKVVFTP
jgi:threonine dehydrogenase-like Zn-dependent dehydrogenase